MTEVSTGRLRAVLGCVSATLSVFAFLTPARAAPVTGSHLTDTSSPVTVISRDELNRTGAINLSDALRTLPSVVNDGDSEAVGSFTGGTATIDLRGLGTKRTLILVDGKRLVSADVSMDIDTNQIPAAMVDHIDVLTGGASAVYGSDAVAGVVNFVLRRDFDRPIFDAQASLADGDGLKYSASLRWGMNTDDGKGNISLWGEYSHRDGVKLDARDFSAHALAATNFTGCAASQPATHFGGYCFSETGIIPDGRIRSLSLGGPTLGATTMFTAGGGIAVYDNRTVNINPYLYLNAPGQRTSFGATGHYAATPAIELYTTLLFSDNKTIAQLPPTPVNDFFNINCGNPQMSATVRQALFGTTPGANDPAGIAAQCATEKSSLVTLTNPIGTLNTRSVGITRLLTEAGPLAIDYDYTSYQMVLGARGGLGYGWNYDVSAQYGHTGATALLQNAGLRTNFQNGLLVNPVTGACLSGGSCSPLNFFTPAGLTPANVDYIRQDLGSDISVRQWDVQATATGDLGFLGIQSPWSKNPVSAAFGINYRNQFASLDPNANLISGNVLGFLSVPPVSGGFDVTEGFMEFRVPIVENAPFFHDLHLNGAYRYGDYNSGGASSYNIGLEWQPVDDLRFRGGFQRAVRAPTVEELFTPAGPSSAIFVAADPCSAASTTPTTSALCIATGVPAASVFKSSLNCPGNVCQTAFGGNRFLKPEASDSWNLGIVFTPTFLPGFTANIDYYNIKLGGVIDTTPTSTILNNCYSTALNPTQDALDHFCSFIHRDSSGTLFNPNLGYVVAADGNVGNNKVQGLDFGANYDSDLQDWGFSGAGSLSANFTGTLVTVNNIDLPGIPLLHCAGEWGDSCGEPQNRFKSNLRLTWTDNTGDFSLSLRWRHLSAVEFEGNLPSTVAPGFNFTNDPTLQIPAFDYFDLSGTWAVADAIDLRAGVRNIFDKDPPVTDNNTAPVSNLNGNTFPNTYDALGRTIFIGATIKY